MRDRLREAQANLRTAEVAYSSEMGRAFPPRTIVNVFLNWKQQNPSRAIVKYYHTDGTLGVALEKPNRRGNSTVKNVHWTSVFRLDEDYESAREKEASE